MRKDIKALISKRKTRDFKSTLACFSICTLLITTGQVFAESAKNPPSSLHSADVYPLIADYRTGDWKYDKRRSHDKSDRGRESHSGEKSREHRDDKIKQEYRTESQHQKQRQSRYQRVKPPVVVVPKHKGREHRDHRVTREYRTESRHHTQPKPRYPRIKPPLVVYPRHHHPRDRVVVRPFRYAYPRHRRHSHDGHIWGLLTFTAITLMILDNLNDQQQREHEQALYSATTTPLGETIHWRDGDASGTVTPTREGTSNSGRYCREYQSEVSVGGNRESVYGTACQQADGSWEIVQ